VKPEPDTSFLYHPWKAGITMNTNNLPLPPAAMARIVQVAADPECSIAQLAAIIRTDPVVSAQVLRSVNSSFYGLRTKVVALERAVNFMGVRALRNLVLCLAVRQFSPRTGAAFSLEQFWECSLRRAVAAKLLAKHAGLAQQEEFFTMGLCQDLGVLVLVGMSEQVAESLQRVSTLPANERLAMERTAADGHDEVGARLFGHWEFPEDLIVPVRFHHDPESAPQSHRSEARILFGAELLADLLGLENKQLILREAVNYLEERLGLDGSILNAIVDEVGETVTKAASMLEIKVGHQPDYREIAEAASHGLLALNMSYEELATELEQSLRRQQKLADQLQQRNRELQALALNDKLTGLLNRRAFDEALDREVSRSRRLNKAISLLLIDVDHFKRINDVCGHLAGDRVLQELARLLRRQVREVDVPARYGGEEFAAILPHTGASGAFTAAERIRKAVEAMRVEFEGQRLRTKVSIGIASVHEAGPSCTAVSLLRAADDALYEAKESGRNRCVQAGTQKVTFLKRRQRC
jgi:diguanylate cyclase (GGDEF)-like protein